MPLDCEPVIAVVSNDQRFVTAVEEILAPDDARIRLADAVTPSPQRAAQMLAPDVVVVDRHSVPDVHRRLRQLRRRWRSAAIMVANAAHEHECGQFLDEGADDACAENSQLLSARLHAMARRARVLTAGTRVSLGDLIIEREHRRVWCAGTELTISHKEYDVLLCLFEHAPEPVSKVTLSACVWTEDAMPTPNALEVYIGYLRRHVSCGDVRIRTIRGFGYALQVADD